METSVTVLVLAACGSANSRIGTEAGIGANGGNGAGGTATPTRIDIGVPSQQWERIARAPC